MSKQIVAVQVSGGEHVKHIAGCALVGKETVSAEILKTPAIIAEIDAGTNYFTNDYQGKNAKVEVVKEPDGKKYIRTAGDGTLSDNLLRLSRYGN